MRYTNNEINSIINKSKMLVDIINEDKSVSKELESIEYLVFAGLLSYYGEETTDIIFKAFQQIDFIYNKGSAFECLVNHPDMTDEYLDFVKKGDPAAFVHSNIKIKDSNDLDIKYTIYLFDKGDRPYVALLEEAIHEVNHIVNSVEKVVWNFNGCNYARSGISFASFSGSSIPEFINLEESINVLQSHEILKHIYQFTDYDIEDQSFKDSLDKMAVVSYEDREPAGYESIVPIVKPLYEDEHFNLVLKKKRMSGDINVIVADFDSKTSDGSFEELSSSLDSIIFDRSSSFLKYYENQSTAKRLVKQYVEHR